MTQGQCRRNKIFEKFGLRQGRELREGAKLSVAVHRNGRQDLEADLLQVQRRKRREQHLPGANVIKTFCNRNLQMFSIS